MVGVTEKEKVVEEEASPSTPHLEYPPFQTKKKKKSYFMSNLVI
jgi:hypothetical protein